jgi:hypothetical protein
MRWPCSSSYGAPDQRTVEGNRVSTGTPGNRPKGMSRPREPAPSGSLTSLRASGPWPRVPPRPRSSCQRRASSSKMTALGSLRRGRAFLLSHAANLRFRETITAENWTGHTVPARHFRAPTGGSSIFQNGHGLCSWNSLRSDLSARERRRRWPIASWSSRMNRIRGSCEPPLKVYGWDAPG